MLTYEYKRLVNWSECDPGGIIFFPNYARWVADGLSMLFIQLGWDPNLPLGGGKGRGIPSVGLNLKFNKPALLHETIVHQIKVTKLGGASMSFSHAILRGDEALMEATETRIWAEHDALNPGGLHSMPIPDALRALLSEDKVLQGKLF